jgi:hypothetical protein
MLGAAFQYLTELLSINAKHIQNKQKSVMVMITTLYLTLETSALTKTLQNNQRLRQTSNCLKLQSEIISRVLEVGTDGRIRAVILTYVRPSVAAEWLTLLLRIRELSGSNLSPETGYPDWRFSWFSSDTSCWDNTLN